MIKLTYNSYKDHHINTLVVIKPLINFKVKKEKIIMISNMKAFLTLIITLFIVSTGKSQIDTITSFYNYH